MSYFGFLMSDYESIEAGGFTTTSYGNSVDSSNTVGQYNLRVYGLVFDDGRYIVPLSRPEEKMNFDYLSYRIDTFLVVSEKMLAIELLQRRDIINGVTNDNITAAFDVLSSMNSRLFEKYGKARVLEYVAAGASDPIELARWLESGKPSSSFFAPKETWFSLWARDSGIPADKAQQMIDAIGSALLDTMIFSACLEHKTRNYSMKIEAPQHVQAVGISFQDHMRNFLNEGYVDYESPSFYVCWLAYFCGIYTDKMARYLDSGFDINRVFAMVVRGFSHEDIMMFGANTDIDLELVYSTTMGV